MSLPESWDGDGWVETEIDGATVRFRGVTFEQYQNALDEAVRRGETGPRRFAEFLEDEHDAETEVVNQ